MRPSPAALALIGACLLVGLPGAAAGQFSRPSLALPNPAVPFPGFRLEADTVLRLADESVSEAIKVLGRDLMASQLSPTSGSYRDIVLGNGWARLYGSVSTEHLRGLFRTYYDHWFIVLVLPDSTPEPDWNKKAGHYRSGYERFFEAAPAATLPASKPKQARGPTPLLLAYVYREGREADDPPFERSQAKLSSFCQELTPKGSIFRQICRRR